MNRTVATGSVRIYDSPGYQASLLEDIRHAKSEIILSSPYPKRKKLQELLPHLLESFPSGTRIALCSRPLAEVKDTYRQNTERLYADLNDSGIHIQAVPGLHLPFIAIDESILWDRSLDPLGIQQVDDT